MSLSTDFVGTLIKQEKALSVKSKALLKTLQNVAVNHEKKIKLVRGILYESLVTYKDKKSSSASEVILACIKLIIVDWQNITNPSAVQLAALIKEALKRACMVEVDIAHFRNLGHCVLDYVSVSNNSVDLVNKWLFYGINQFCKMDFPCSCSSKMNCSLLETFHLELQGFKVQSIAEEDSQVCSVGNLTTAAIMHLNRAPFKEGHLLKVVNASERFVLSSNEEASSGEPCLDLMKNAILLEGRLSLKSKNVTNIIDKILTALKSMHTQQTGKSHGYKESCLCILNPFLTTLTKHCERLNGCFSSGLECIDLFCSIVGEKLSIEIIARIVYLFHKITTTENVDAILKRITALIDQSNGILDFKQSTDESLSVKFFEAVVRICMVAVNCKDRKNLDLVVDDVLQKALALLKEGEYSEGTKLSTLLTNVGTVLVKVKRKLGDYLTAMDVAEFVLAAAPIEITKSLVAQWCKAKLSTLQDGKNKKGRELKKRTLASNLTGKIPEKFLTEILILELEWYESLKVGSHEKLAVVTDILSLDNDVVKDVKRQLSCKEILLKFELGDPSNGNIDLATAYKICKPQSDDCWEYFTQIKMVEFLNKWNHMLGHNGCESSVYIGLSEIYDIVEAWEDAAKKHRSLTFIEGSCKLAQNVAAVLGLFGNNLQKLKVMAALWTLLTEGSSSNAISDTTPRLRNISSSLCEIAISYLALNRSLEAEKYSNLAQKAFEEYEQYVKKEEPSDSELEACKALFFRLNTTCANVLIACGRDDEANHLLDTCANDDFIQMDNLCCSTTAVFCSVQVLNITANLTSEECDPRATRLQATLKRIASLKASILPGLHSIQKSGSSLEKQSFGVQIEGVCVDIQLQFKVIHLFFQNLYDLAETYILIGNPFIAGSYIKTGLVHAKYLHLKTWYLGFCLLKLKLTSCREDADVFQQLCKVFCELVRCDCLHQSKKGTMLEDSFLQGDDGDDEQEYFEINEDDTGSEVLGSTDEDAILIPTKSMDIGCYQSNSNDVFASPEVSRNRKRKSFPVPPIFQKSKSCSCGDISSIVLQLNYANTISDYCTRTNMPEEGLDVCFKALKVISCLGNESVIPGFEEINSSTDFVGYQHVAAQLTSAWLYSIRNDTKNTLACCEAAQKLIEDFSVTSATVFLLKSKVHFLLSCSMDQVQKIEDPPTFDYHFLNALIDGLAKTHILESTSPRVHTPVASRSQRRPAISKSTKSESKTKTPAKTIKGKSVMEKRQIKGAEDFKIFTDKQENGNLLPVPEFHDDRSPSPSAVKVYDFESSDDGKKATAKTLLKDSQNIMLARKAANKRNRKQFGMVYTDDAKEAVRGRVRKTTKSKSRAKPDSALTTEENSVNLHSRIPSGSVGKQIHHLEQALSSASKAGDFLLTKLAAQALSRCYYEKYKLNEDINDLTQSSVFHLFSIGVGTRAAMQIYTRTMKNIPCAQKGCGDACRCGSKLHDLTEQRNVLKNVLEDGGRYITEATDLLPPKWTVCAISNCQLSGGESTMLITRLRNGEVPLHVEIRGDALRNIIISFEDLMDRNIAALSSRDHSYWWTQRRNLDVALKNIIESFAQNALGHHVGIVLGRLSHDDADKKLKLSINEIGEKFKIPKQNFQLIEVLLNSWHYLTVEQKLLGVWDICDHETTKEQTVAFAKELETTSTRLKLIDENREHVILILDKDAQLLPWENIPQLRNFSVTRLPSIDLLKMQLGLLRSAERNIAKEGVNFKDVSYILNPGGDLKKSEERFQEWFQSVKSWKGIVSRAPLQNEWISSISDFDLFIYCGHGSGQKYVSSNDFRNIRTRAAALLMGCGSAKLDQDGVFEPNGIVVHYLMTGSPCILGCLWKVTDKDTDMYLCKLIQHWADGKKLPISLSAIEAQRCMKMPHINGSACVIYGLPIHCQVTIAKFLDNPPKI